MNEAVHNEDLFCKAKNSPASDMGTFSSSPPIILDHEDFQRIVRAALSFFAVSGSSSQSAPHWPVRDPRQDQTSNTTGRSVSQDSGPFVEVLANGFDEVRQEVAQLNYAMEDLGQQLASMRTSRGLDCNIG
jgi:hypothetical protein